MSARVGLIAILPPDGSAQSGVDGFSERTHELLDEEVRRIIDEARSDVTAVLQLERQRLDALAEALLEDETLDEPDAYAAAGVLRPADAALHLA